MINRIQQATLRVTTPVARQLARLTQAQKRLGARIGVTRETVPNAILWPFRRAAYWGVRAGAAVQNAVRGVLP